MDRPLTIRSAANQDSNLPTTATIETLVNRQEAKATTTVELLKETVDQLEAILPPTGTEDGVDGYLEDKEEGNHREAWEVLEVREVQEALEAADTKEADTRQEGMDQEAVEAEVEVAGATVAPALTHKVPQESRSSTSLTSSHILN